MKRFAFTFALAAVLALPAAASANRLDGEKDAAEHCKAKGGEPPEAASSRAFGDERREGDERGKGGECRFERRKPKLRLRQRLKEEAFTNAVRACRAEFVADPAAFEEKYRERTAEASRDEGEPRREDGEPRKSHPFRRCVHLKFKEAVAALRESFDNAARECKAERAEDRAAFRAKYGKNRNRRNALGKCVSRRVKEDIEREGPGDGKEPVSPAPDAGRE